MFNETFKNKRIFITGHTGFKGSWLTLWLRSLGAEICGYSNKTFGNNSHFEILQLRKEIIHEIGDICDYANLNNLIKNFKPEIIFHLAAQAVVQDSIKDPLLTISTNTLGTATILDIAKTINSLQAMVIITSDKVYENREWAWGYRETDKLGGKDPYSASKAAAELLINSYLNSYFQDADAIVTIGRAGNVIGGGDWANQRIVPDCIRAWQKNEPAKIRNPLATRPWQHVLEPLSGYLRLAELALSGEQSIQFQPYNFGPKQEDTKNVEQLIKHMSKYWPGSSWVINEKNKQTNSLEAGYLSLSCEKANQQLSWFPTWDFDETVKNTVDWYQNFTACDSFNAQDFSLGQIVKYCNSAKRE